MSHRPRPRIVSGSSPEEMIKSNVCVLCVSKAHVTCHTVRPALTRDGQCGVMVHLCVPAVAVGRPPPFRVSRGGGAKGVSVVRELSRGVELFLARPRPAAARRRHKRGGRVGLRATFTSTGSTAAAPAARQSTAALPPDTWPPFAARGTMLAPCQHSAGTPPARRPPM